MLDMNLYKDNSSIFQKYISLTNQKQILIDKVCKKIIDNINLKKIKLLDIGCADGAVTLKIIENIRNSYQLEVTVIEASTELINRFKSKMEYDINFINENVESIDILPQSDFILMAHIVSYINNLDCFLDKIINSLNENGIALIVVSNDYSDDKKVKNYLNNSKDKNSTSTIVKSILSKKKIKYDVEIVESNIDVSGIEEMNEKGKVIIEFLEHKKIEDISDNRINDMRNMILNIAKGNKKIIKLEDYIWIQKI